MSSSDRCRGESESVVAPKKTKTVVTLSLIAVIGVIVVLVYLGRYAFLEFWHLYRFEGLESERQLVTVEWLAEHGGRRAAAGLIEIARDTDDRELEKAAVEATARVFPRLGIRARHGTAIGLRRLLEVGRSGMIGPPADETLPAYLVRTIVDLAKSDPAILPDLSPGLRHRSKPKQKVVATAIAQHADTLPNFVERLFEKAEPDELVAFLRPTVASSDDLYKLEGVDLPRDRALQMRRSALAVAARIARNHETPKVRAVALSFAVNPFSYDLKALRVAYEEDPSLIVRLAAIRIAGYVGGGEGALDLSKLLLTQDDPRILTEVIQARTLWCARGYPFHGFELWDGFHCDWAGGFGAAAASLKFWERKELDRLRQLLAGSRDPELRDAASLALASRYREIELTWRDPPEPLSAPGLAVHEWAVWKAGGRSIKPAVFFHTAGPISALVRVAFLERNPWTSFPRATDFAYVTEASEFSLQGRSSRTTGTEPPENEPTWPPYASSLSPDKRSNASRSTKEVGAGKRSPPRSKLPQPTDSAAPRAHPRSGVDSRFHRSYPVAPWLSHSTGSRTTARVGLEWCGLRVGYPAELEGEPPSVETDSWWRHLRDAAGARVAVRGESDGVLSYSGETSLQGPMRVSWSTGAKDELFLGVRPFHEYPEERRRRRCSIAGGSRAPSATECERPGRFPRCSFSSGRRAASFGESSSRT